MPYIEDPSTGQLIWIDPQEPRYANPQPAPQTSPVVMDVNKISNTLPSWLTTPQKNMTNPEGLFGGIGISGGAKIDPLKLPLSGTSATDSSSTPNTYGDKPQTYTDSQGFTYMLDPINGWQYVGKTTIPTQETGSNAPDFNKASKTFYGSDGQEYQYNEYGLNPQPTGNYDETKDVTYQRDLKLQKMTQVYQTQLQQQQMAQAQQQWLGQMAYQNQQLEQQRQATIAELAANPQSWLQSAAYTGKAPVVQPWMLPLASEQYGWQPGANIPNWSAGDMTQIPQLKSPSAQYWARMAPDQRSQYYGYEAARTGQTPESVQSTMQAFAPSSNNVGYRWLK
jgi:hypothetical protein